MPITLDFDEEGNVVGQPKERQEETVEESSEVEPEKSDFSDVVGSSIHETLLYKAWEGIRKGTLPEPYTLQVAHSTLEQVDPDFNLNETLEERQVPQEDRSYFEHVRNPKQFEITYDYYLQDKEDEEILNNAGLLSKLGGGIAALPADPLFLMTTLSTSGLGLAVGALRKPIASAALFGGIYNASSYAAKQAVWNRNISLKDMAIEATAGAFANLGLYGLGKGASKLFKPLKESVIASITPAIDNMFLQEAGVLKESSSPLIQQAKRYVWKFFNPTPMWQMYNSGNEQLRKMAPKIYGFRTSNLAGKDALNDIAITERLNLYNGDALKLSEEVYGLREQFIKEGGTGAAFDSEVGLTIAEREIDPNTLVGKAAKKIVDFDNKYIQFGEEGIKSERFVLTKELADMPREAFEKAVREGSLPKTNVTAKRHIKRIYDTEAIDANMDMATELLEREVLLNNPELPESSEEVTKTVDRIINSITGDRPSAFRSETASHQPNASKAREIAITDEVLLERGLIKYDSVTNHINSIKSELVDQELDKIASAEGYKGWRDRSIGNDPNPNYMIDDFELKSREAGGAERRKTRNDDIGKANKENYSYMLRLLNDTEMLLKGTYSKSGWAANLGNMAFFRGARDATTCAYSGMLWAAQIPDIAQIGMREGFSKPLKRMAPFIFKKDTLDKVDRETLYKFLDLLDSSAQANRFVDLGYVPESQRTWVFRPSKDDSQLKNVARNVLTVGVEASNLMTTLYKRNAAQGIYSDLIEACIKSDREFLNKMGINKKQAQTIADLFYKYGDLTKNIKYFDPNNIKDVKLQEQVRASVETLTDEIIASPNAGNVPRMLRGGPGAWLFMFVSYPFMLFNNVYKPLLRGDISKSLFATSVAASLALSTARKGIVDYLNDKETDWDDLDTWKEVYVYSNLDTHIFDGIDMLWRGVTRRDLLGAVSPAYQWMNNIIQVGHQLCRGKLGTRKQRNLFPPFNFGPLRPFTNWMLYENHKHSSW